MFLGIFFSRSLRGHVTQMPPLLNLRKLVLWLLLFVFLHWMAMWKFESLDLFNSLWLTMITFATIGYGDVYAKTVLGKLATMIIGVGGGIALLAALFSAFFEAKQFIRDLRRNGRMDNKFKKFYVIFNFPGEGVLTDFISEILVVEKDAKFCVVDGRIECLPDSLSARADVIFVKGPTIQKDTYERAKVKEASKIIIFPTVPGSSDSDAITKTIVELVSGFVNESIGIIHILVDHRNGWMFEKTRSVQISETLEINVLIQECQDPFSAIIFQQLFLNSAGANPHTVKPTKVVGWKWSKFIRKMMDYSENGGCRLNVLSLVENGVPDSCPRADATIGSNCFISIIAFNDFVWEEVEAKIAA
jgi:voltage-gated potassium channel